jgi:hypothetical protein
VTKPEQEAAMLIEHVQGATVYGFQAVQKAPMIPRLVSTTIRPAPIGARAGTNRIEFDAAV